MWQSGLNVHQAHDGRSKRQHACLLQLLYTHGVDGKRRVQVPAKWRPESPDVEFTPIVGAQVATRPVLARFAAGADVQADGGYQYHEQRRSQQGRAQAVHWQREVQVALDKAGRICLPEAMAKLAGIKKEAVLVGLLDRFEI